VAAESGASSASSSVGASQRDPSEKSFTTSS
jgi:hypothetical protein